MLLVQPKRIVIVDIMNLIVRNNIIRAVQTRCIDPCGVLCCSCSSYREILYFTPGNSKTVLVRSCDAFGKSVVGAAQIGGQCIRKSYFQLLYLKK